MTRDDRYEEVYNDTIMKGEPKTMCEVLDRLIGEGEARGREEGRKEGMVTGFLNGMTQLLLSYMKKNHCSAEAAMDEFDIDASQRDALRPLLA